MKKGLIILMVLVILIIMSFAVFIMLDKKVSNEDKADITMTIQKETLTRQSATIILESKNDYSCGESYSIDEKEDGEWKSINEINSYPFNLLGLIPGKDGKIECNLDWSQRYGELENGEYRIVKSVDTAEGKRELYVEFVIE